MTDGILLVHAAATWAMVGIIWMVHLVQYPGFELVRGDAFPAFHRHHSTRISWVVGPLMTVEGLSALALVAWRPAGLAPWAPLLGLALLAVCLGTTLFVSVPLHERLARGFDEAAAHRLLTTNVVRAFAWTARGALALAFLAAYAG